MSEMNEANDQTAATAAISLDALDAIQLDALREVGNIGAGTAAASLSAMTGERVAMGVPSVKIIPIERVPDQVGGDEALVVAVYLQVIGDAPGHIVFILQADMARELCDTLMGGMDPGEPGPTGFSEMQISALQEIGNIMTGSYLRALADLTRLHLEPMPPALGIDMAAALISSVVAEVARTVDLALIIETQFEDEETPSIGYFAFIPEPDSLGVVLKGLGLIA
ncbi:MAG: chemotaxis protein CheC [Thermoleophilia bacterium]|nr:chemotaxis protein CheC [Thermoleophilia bacterium]